MKYFIERIIAVNFLILLIILDIYYFNLNVINNLISIDYNDLDLYLDFPLYIGECIDVLINYNWYNLLLNKNDKILFFFIIYVLTIFLSFFFYLLKDYMEFVLFLY